ncbi:hypothetical protein R1sor_016185 [Riccia sorocarpa]|uniref:Reverse transcriptase domain-containing protein n=1 Tax=Riccia sorocarpa TaxID=122646 RepID=A0ABD3HIG2_9MARC
MQRELQEAREWKARSRDKWLAEDAVSARYFFTKLKAKLSRESAEVLKDPAGDILIGREEIFEEIHRFFQSCIPQKKKRWTERRNGRRLITDNILSLKFGQEWAEWTNQRALFVKLDFIKAYDRADHRFLWEVLAKQGFNSQCIQLIQGFTCGGTARVHINGGFTPEIQVARDVRQGCPLAPLMFALCTQPFMCLLRQAQQSGRIQGLEIEPGHTLLHQLFVDDTGVCIQNQKDNFNELLRILAKYERVSGTKINICKSLVMPLGGQDVPNWVHHIGCEVASSGRTFKYLGIQMGVDLDAGEYDRAALRRLNSRLLQWEIFYLPWTARLVLIKHVLTQIPSYTMMAVGCDTMAADGKEVQWARIARRMAQIKLAIGPGKLEKLHWSSEEALLLLPSLRFPEAPTLDRLLKVWFRYDEKAGERSVPSTRRKAKQLRKVSVQDVLTDAGRIVTSELLTADESGNGEDLIRSWLDGVQPSESQLQKISGWFWVEGSPVINWWHQSNKEWTRQLCRIELPYDPISRHWEA